MNTSEIMQQLRALLATRMPQVTIPPGEAFETAPIAKTLGMDSLEIVRLVVALETHFAVELSDSELVRVRTFGDLANAIAQAPACATEEVPGSMPLS
ncbi:acyl carrier protein [Candidatus Thiosymbion oneisti]|uniref:acyl carrier protein n=1 Tax=Candidatus Thiosymbion oneisti TaxID=589554 RepID=UPI000B7DC209|nr:acyl carrier protein [Candidatus Thiosymbion oneisti]